MTINGDLSVGNGSTLTVAANTYAPNVNLVGSLTLNSGVTWTKSVSGQFNFKPTGTKSWTDLTAAKQDLGTVRIISGTSTPKITLGSSVKAKTVLIDTSHELDVNGSNTITLSGTGVGVINNLGTFRYATGTVAYVANGSVLVTAMAGSAGTNGYYNLEIKPGGAVTHTIGTVENQTIRVNGDLTLGDGVNAGTVTAATYNHLTLNNGSEIFAAGGAR